MKEPARISIPLAHAIDSGAWELSWKSGRYFKGPGRLVRIALYNRMGLAGAAKQLGLTPGALTEWLRAEGIEPLHPEFRKHAHSKRTKAKSGVATNSTTASSSDGAESELYKRAVSSRGAASNRRRT